MHRQIAVLAAVLLAAPLAAEAQSYRCVGTDGKKHYGQTIPQQCVGQVVEELNKQGIVVRRIDPQASAAQRATKQAEEEAKKKEDAAVKEEQRRAKALLATYTSEKDIELARQRALDDNQKAAKEIEGRVASLKKRHGELKKELEFFQGKNAPPARLLEDIKSTEIDLKAQEASLAARQKEVERINAKYDDDKKRYIELTKGSTK
jgi:chromosome segregation ATPase